MSETHSPFVMKNKETKNSRSHLPVYQTYVDPIAFVKKLMELRFALVIQIIMDHLPTADPNVPQMGNALRTKHAINTAVETLAKAPVESMQNVL